MSYREENDQVVLTMSREDYELVLMMLGMATGHCLKEHSADLEKALNTALALMNRLNSGNPHYTPYQEGSMGARGEFDAGEENRDEDVVMFVCMKCGAEVWQPVSAPRICDHCGHQLVANPRRG